MNQKFPYFNGEIVIDLKKNPEPHFLKFGDAKRESNRKLNKKSSTSSKMSLYIRIEDFL